MPYALHSLSLSNFQFLHYQIQVHGTSRFFSKVIFPPLTYIASFKAQTLMKKNHYLRGIIVLPIKELALNSFKIQLIHLFIRLNSWVNSN